MKRMYRSINNRLVGGVFGGLSEYLELDPVLVRIIAVFVTLVTGIVPVALIYLLSVFVIPNREG